MMQKDAAAANPLRRQGKMRKLETTDFSPSLHPKVLLHNNAAVQGTGLQ